VRGAFANEAMDGDRFAKDMEEADGERGVGARLTGRGAREPWLREPEGRGKRSRLPLLMYSWAALRGRLDSEEERVTLTASGKDEDDGENEDMWRPAGAERARRWLLQKRPGANSINGTLQPVCGTGTVLCPVSNATKVRAAVGLHAAGHSPFGYA
jgi:hypothetical protein